LSQFATPRSDRSTRLRHHARVLAVPEGWLVRTAAAIERVEPDPPLPEPERLLELLDGHRDVPAIAEALGAPEEAVEGVLQRFRGLGLIGGAEEHAQTQPEGVRATDRGRAKPSQAPGTIRILMLGEGDLAAGVGRALQELGAVDVEPGGAEPDLAGLDHAVAATDLVVCCLGRPSALVDHLADLCGGAGRPLVVVDVDEEGGLVGALVPRERADSRRGCLRCARLHRSATDEFLWALERDLPRRFPRPARWKAALPVGVENAVAPLAALAARRALGIAQGGEHDDDRPIALQWADSTAYLLEVPKHPECPSCFPVPPPSARDERRRAVESWWQRLYTTDADEPIGLGELRRRLDPLIAGELSLFGGLACYGPEDRRALFDFFEERGVDPRGSRIAQAEHAVVAWPKGRARGYASVAGEGLDFEDRRAAEALALVEALERSFALDGCDPAHSVRARYAEVTAQAIDPRELPLYADEQYADPDFPLCRFDPDTELHWLWGVRLGTGAPVLVPRDVVYAAPPPAIFNPTSNGAACHTSLPHAVRGALYETLERDALMVTWLDRLSLPRHEPGPADPDPLGLRGELERLGFELRHVDVSTDLDVPVTLAVLRDRRNPDFLLVDMAADLDPERRLGKLYKELTQFLHPYLVDREHYRGEATRSWEPACVRDFPDHLAFYQDREKQRLAAFLDASAELRPLAPPTAAPATVTEEVEVLASRLSRRGYEVIVVDCTHRLLRPLGLHAVKVLVPGLQPLHAGFQLRVLGGRRLFRVPMLLGLEAAERSVSDLNPWPHPLW
jgi:ribosomal protein S12 methylthiotransferase accessory factor